jgi:YfiH family protein
VTNGRAESPLLCDPVLESVDVVHGFGQRGARVPESTIFPRQVHGVAVVRAESCGAGQAVATDAITSMTAGQAVGIVTADCVPILVAAADGTRVVAIHAGWRGLAAGVIEAGLEAIGRPASALRAAVGPAARGCCYEVDGPVTRALAERQGDLLAGVLAPGRPGHSLLDLPELAVRVLARAGLSLDCIGTTHLVCTICTPGPRFESYRRDGTAAGRLRHFIAPGRDAGRSGPLNRAQA